MLSSFVMFCVVPQQAVRWKAQVVLGLLVRFLFGAANKKITVGSGLQHPNP